MKITHRGSKLGQDKPVSSSQAAYILNKKLFGKAVAEEHSRKKKKPR